MRWETYGRNFDYMELRVRVITPHTWLTDTFASIQKFCGYYGVICKGKKWNTMNLERTKLMLEARARLEGFS